MKADYALLPMGPNDDDAISSANANGGSAGGAGGGEPGAGSKKHK